MSTKTSINQLVLINKGSAAFSRVTHLFGGILPVVLTGEQGGGPSSRTEEGWSQVGAEQRWVGVDEPPGRAHH